jgi:thioesterase domain-containing protein
MLTHLIQQRLGFALPFTLVVKAPTIHELANSILDATSFGESAIDHPLVPLSTQLTGPSVFGFPPGTGDALGYRQLADHLKPFAFYAFNFIELETRLKDYADLITGVDPVGPYRLFGYSGGGNLAFRTAVELERRGKTVSDVVMLDSSRFLEKFQLPTNEPRRLAMEFLDSDEVKRYVKGPILRDKVLRTIDRYFDYLSRTQDSDIINANIHVVVSENSEDNYHDESGHLVISKSGWADVTHGKFRTYQGHGDHAHMLHRPHTESNAVILREILSGWFPSEET